MISVVSVIEILWTNNLGVVEILKGKCYVSCIYEDTLRNIYYNINDL